MHRDSACTAHHRDLHPSSAPTILVVDDDAGIRQVLSCLLEYKGYQVRVAGNGEEAHASLMNDPLPSLILLDLSMPMMDGHEFIRLRQADARMRDVPVIVFSGDVDTRSSGLEARAVALGVERIVPKTCGVDRLLQAVQSLVIPVSQ